MIKCLVWRKYHLEKKQSVYKRVNNCINYYYNERPHLSLNMMTPNESICQLANAYKINKLYLSNLHNLWNNPFTRVIFWLFYWIYSRITLFHGYRRVKKSLIILCIFLVLLSIPSLFSFVVYLNLRSNLTSISAELDYSEYTLVLGAGIRADGKPSKVLRQRLDGALDIIRNRKSSKLILSGSEAIELDYSEPEVMRDYLLNNGIDENSLILDRAGENTEQSCRNVIDVYGVNKVIVVTNSFHIKRSVYLCKTYGIDTQGLIAETDFVNSQFFSWYVIRDNLGLLFYFLRLNRFR